MAADGTDDPGFAPAKINLALHVTGRRPDGYHLLDSLVVFADVGDRVTARPAPDLSLTVGGPMGGALSADGDNLVMRAARWLSDEGQGPTQQGPTQQGPARQGAALHLLKALPVASGIGGGSSDAAAALRVLCGLWSVPMPDAARLAALGADVPVCLSRQARRMRGIGERLGPVPALPDAWFVLVNPMRAVPTQAVFRALPRHDHAPMPEALAPFQDFRAFAAFLAMCRNDLEPPAQAVEPEVGTALNALAADPGCALARMSGSGATCFGLFETQAQAQAAASRIAAARPGWWVVSARMIG